MTIDQLSEAIIDHERQRTMSRIRGDETTAEQHRVEAEVLRARRRNRVQLVAAEGIAGFCRDIGYVPAVEDERDRFDLDEGHH